MGNAGMGGPPKPLPSSSAGPIGSLTDLKRYTPYLHYPLLLILVLGKIYSLSTNCITISSFSVRFARCDSMIRTAWQNTWTGTSQPTEKRSCELNNRCPARGFRAKRYLTMHSSYLVRINNTNIRNGPNRKGRSQRRKRLRPSLIRGMLKRRKWRPPSQALWLMKLRYAHRFCAS